MSQSMKSPHPPDVLPQELPVFTLPEFCEVPLGEKNRLTLRKMGDSIVFAEIKGPVDLGTYDMNLHYEIIENFLKAASVRMPYVEITAADEYSNQLSVKSRETIFRHLREKQSVLVGFSICGLPMGLRLVSSAGLRLSRLRVKHFFCYRPAQAIAKARQIL